MANQKKGRKAGRCKTKCDRYRKAHMREKNRMRDLRKHVKHNENDNPAASMLKSWEKKGVPIRKPSGEMPVMVR